MEFQKIGFLKIQFWQVEFKKIEYFKCWTLFCIFKNTERNVPQSGLEHTLTSCRAIYIMCSTTSNMKFRSKIYLAYVSSVLENFFRTYLIPPDILKHFVAEDIAKLQMFQPLEFLHEIRLQLRVALPHWEGQRSQRVVGWQMVEVRYIALQIQSSSDKGQRLQSRVQQLLKKRFVERQHNGSGATGQQFDVQRAQIRVLGEDCHQKSVLVNFHHVRHVPDVDVQRGEHAEEGCFWDQLRI